MKIPYLLTTHAGTIIAFAEARTGSCSDYARTSLVYKRSSDNGNTWSPLAVLHANASAVIGNAAPVQDAASGRILVPFCRNNSQVLYTFSDDDGQSWAPVVHLAAATRPDWGWIGLGPPGGVQLPTGRIVIPSYHGPFHWDDGTFTHVHVLYTDDVGTSWHIGCVFDMHTDPYFTNENQAAVAQNGSLLINARTIVRHRAQAWSHDGGETCTPMVLAKDLPQPFDGCEGSTVAFPPGGNTSTLFFTNPDEDALLGLRYNLTLKASKDSGATWSHLRLLDPRPSGYSALTVAPDRSVGVLYETTNHTEIVMVPQHIVYTTAFRP